MKTFHFFGIPISFLGLTTAIGVLIGFFVAKREFKRKGLDVNKLYDLSVYAVLSGLIGARLFYVLFYNFDYYLKNPVDIIKINDGGMSIHGALILAFIVSFIYIRKNKLSFLNYADAIAPSIILGQGIGRVGCDVFGKPMNTSYFWGVMYQGQLVHPVQVYEFILNYLVFFLLWRLRKKTKYSGQLFFLYVILFAINRGIVEFFRINPSIYGWFSISHLLSLLFIIGALTVMFFVKKKSKISSNNNTLSEITEEDSKKNMIIGLLKEVAILIILIFVSLMIFYTVQG